MADALWMRLREVEWERFSTSDGSNVPNLLKNLSSRKLPRAMKASHQVWTAFCGGGEVHSAAIPAAPYLVEIMFISDPGVQDGIIDVLSRLASENGEAREAVAAEKAQLKKLLKSKDEIVAAKVADLLASLA